MSSDDNQSNCITLKLGTLKTWLVSSTSKISKISLVSEQFSARIVLINAAVDKCSHSQVDKKNTLCNTNYKF